MINNKNNRMIDELWTFANENNLLKSFNETYSRLENYLAKGYQVTLYSDFAPLSMELSITGEGKPVLYGGYILHGPMMPMVVEVHFHFHYPFSVTGKLDGVFTYQ